MSKERAAYVTSDEAEGGEDMTPAGIAASHCRHYAALLGRLEPGTAVWQFTLGQLSAAATLANLLRGQVK